MRISPSHAFIPIFICAQIFPVQFSTAAHLKGLPKPGQAVHLSKPYEPVMIKALRVDPQDHLHLDFIISPGEGKTDDEFLRREGERLIKYFFAALAIPQKNMWVNLSPYERSRITPGPLGQTALGRDLLAQDYLLKQLTSSLIHPHTGTGKGFWEQVYRKAKSFYGHTHMPINTSSKVWVTAGKAVVFEENGTAVILDGTLRVLTEEDYLALSKQSAKPDSLSAKVLKEVILPEIEKEINVGKNFVRLRQAFYALILSSWYKKRIISGILHDGYIDRSMIKGIGLKDASINQKIYAQYLQAYRKGVFNFIDEDATGPKKYFSGGVMIDDAFSPEVVFTRPKTGGANDPGNYFYFKVLADVRKSVGADPAMSSKEGVVFLNGKPYPKDKVKDILKEFDDHLSVPVDVADRNSIVLRKITNDDLFLIGDLIADINRSISNDRSDGFLSPNRDILLLTWGEGISRRKKNYDLELARDTIKKMLADLAMNSVGGIDFNDEYLNLRIKNQVLKAPAAPIGHGLEEVIPRIIEIKPLSHQRELFDILVP